MITGPLLLTNEVVHGGILIDLQKPRFQILVDHDVDSEDLKGTVAEGAHSFRIRIVRIREELDEIYQ